MGDSDATATRTPAASAVAGAEEPAAKPSVKKGEKANKKPAMTVEGNPHVTGRLLLVEIGANGVEFSVKGKKGKAMAFSLNGFEQSRMTAATALLGSVLQNKGKLRVEYTAAGDSKGVTRISAHS
jgi:hypothetical protein